MTHELKGVRFKIRQRSELNLLSNIPFKFNLLTTTTYGVVYLYVGLDLTFGGERLGTGVELKRRRNCGGLNGMDGI